MFIDLDLSGAEWVVVAYLCRDENMLRVVKSGKSPHVVTGSLMTGVPEELVEKEEKLVKHLKDPLEIQAIRKAEIPEIFTAKFLPRTMSIRQAGKRGNHSSNYRITAPTFSLTQEIELADAKRIVESYTCQSPSHGQPGHNCGPLAYPRIRDWWDETDAKVKATRTLTNCFGQKVQFMGQINHDLFKQAYAFVPQSTVVAITNRAMPLILEDESPAFEPLHLVAQVHDSLLIDYLSDDCLAMATAVHKIAYDYMRPELNYGEPFKLNVTGKVGFTWGSLKEIDLPDDVEAIARSLAKARESAKTKA
jgi:DNA polymerase I-like protein with 3'-5' exonuclease and polymerase domains